MLFNTSRHGLAGKTNEADIREFFIITGWRGNVIREHFGDGSRWKVSVTYGEQTVQDGTGKAPEIAKAWIGSEKFLMSYGDILLSPPTDYKLLANSFKEDGVIALKKVSPEELSKGGAVVLDDNDFMVELIEKGDPSQLSKNAFYNAGIYLLTPEIFKYTAKLQKSPRNEYEFTDALKAFVAGGAKLRGVTLLQAWADVRDPSVLSELNNSRRRSSKFVKNICCQGSRHVVTLN
jgi:dTDP-glucose pyrophosphorylase